MSNHTEFAERLTSLYHQRKDLQIRLSHLDADYDARALAITPEKWPGSNEGERKASRDKAFAADETLNKIAALQSAARDELDELKTEIDVTETLWKAAQWDWRERYMLALGAAQPESEIETPF